MPVADRGEPVAGWQGTATPKVTTPFRIVTLLLPLLLPFKYNK
jgi:hypothetical protein